MGMQNSAQSFQRMVQDVLKDLPNTFVYLDDILVYNDNMEDHLKTQNRLDQEWEAVSGYVADPGHTAAAQDAGNTRKSRYPDVLPCEFCFFFFTNIYF